MRRRRSIVPWAGAILVIAVPTALIKAGIISEYMAQIITLSGVNAIMALSVNIICGITGQLSLGQAGFMAIGAYTAAILTKLLGLPLPVSIIASGIVTMIAGFLIGFPTLRLEGDYLAIVTLGFGEIIRVIIVNMKKWTGGPNGMQFPTILTLDPALAYLVIITSLVVLVAAVQNIVHSTYGRAILAVRDDPIAAAASGIGVFKYKMAGFIAASFTAGIGGALYAPFIGFIKPEQASFTKSIDYLIFVVLGGMGSTTGSVLASFVLTYLQEALRILQNYRLLIYPVILIIVMLFRPSGLMGHKEFSPTAAWRALLSRRKKERI